jgi:MFS family permease
MKIDLVGPRRRGRALGLNESAGYLGVAAAAFVTGLLAGSIAPITLVWAGGAVIALAGLLSSLLFVRDTDAHVALEQRRHGGRAHKISLRQAFPLVTYRDPVLRACSQAGS